MAGYLYKTAMAFMGLKNAASFKHMREHFDLICHVCVRACAVLRSVCFVFQSSFEVIEKCLVGEEDDDVCMEVIEFWSTCAEWEAKNIQAVDERMSSKVSVCDE